LYSGIKPPRIVEQDERMKMIVVDSTSFIGSGKMAYNVKGFAPAGNFSSTARLGRSFLQCTAKILMLGQITTVEHAHSIARLA
jgi:hypothetical protein